MVGALSKQQNAAAKKMIASFLPYFSEDPEDVEIISISMDPEEWNLWICWTPGKPQQPKQVANGYVPPNVTDRAVALREQADKIGILATLHQLGLRDALVPYSIRLADLSIDEMNLTVRSSNGLKRANAGTFGRLRDLLSMENGILSVRNLGQKSAKEIKQLFFEECYTRLLPYEKAQYWQEILDS